MHTDELAAKVNYAALAPAADPQSELEAELAAFAALHRQLTQPTTGGADTDPTPDLA